MQTRILTPHSSITGAFSPALVPISQLEESDSHSASILSRLRAIRKLRPNADCDYVVQKSACRRSAHEQLGCHFRVSLLDQADRTILSLSPARISIRASFAYADVDDFVAAKAHDFNGTQQTSISRLQLVQVQSLGFNGILQISITLKIWFGTRCSTRKTRMELL